MQYVDTKHLSGDVVSGHRGNGSMDGQWMILVAFCNLNDSMILSMSEATLSVNYLLKYLSGTVSKCSDLVDNQLRGRLKTLLLN